VFDYPHFLSSHTHNGDDTIPRSKHSKFGAQGSLLKFYIHGSVRRDSDLIIVQKGATVFSLFVRAPDDGCQHPKHVELPREI